MFLNHLHKKLHFSLVLLFSALIILFIIDAARAQLLPYLSFYQPFSLTAPVSLVNNTFGLSSTVPFNPYYTGFNPFSFYNGFFAYNTFSRVIPQYSAPALPKATVAGGLVPFVNAAFSPITNPYLAAAYFAAAVTADVSGSWAGQWISNFLVGGVTTGDLSITLAQLGTDVTGTAVFLLNKVLKFGAAVVGTVEGNVLTLNSTVVTSVLGTMTFDVTIIATVTDFSMEGTYEVINLTTGLIAEQGVFTATRI